MYTDDISLLARTSLDQILPLNDQTLGKNSEVMNFMYNYKFFDDDDDDNINLRYFRSGWATRSTRRLWITWCNRSTGTSGTIRSARLSGWTWCSRLDRCTWTIRTHWSTRPKRTCRPKRSNWRAWCNWSSW